jgi:putative acetyltransferase
MDAFEPARALYRTAGFTACGPFDGYVPSAASAFMTRTLG